MGQQVHAQRKSFPTAAIAASHQPQLRLQQSQSFQAQSFQAQPLVPIQSKQANQEKSSKDPEPLQMPSQKSASLQAQIDRATRFGHHLNRIQIYPAGQSSGAPSQISTAGIQRKVTHGSNTHLYIQRQVVDEERKRDEETENRQMKSEDQPIQGFFLGMLIGAIIKPILKMLFPDGGGGGGGGGGADGGAQGGAGGGGAER